MVQTIQAKDIDLRYLIDNFGLQLVQDDQFFPEWQEKIPEITDLDKQLLDKVKAGYFNPHSARQDVVCCACRKD